jgi:hypothetical protein
MSIVKVDASNDANFSQKKLISKGTYLFEIADVKIKEAASGANYLNVELRCQDEGEFKGNAVFDAITLTKKAEWKFCHLALAAGFTKDDVANGINTDELKGRYVKAEVSIAPPNTRDGKTYKEKNTIDAYMFEVEQN